MIINPAKPKQQLILLGIFSILLLLFLFSFVGSTISLRLVGVPKINGTVYFISRMLYWAALLLTWLYAVKIEKQKMLIWDEQKYLIGFYLVSIVLVFLALFAGLVLIRVLFSAIGLSPKSSTLSELVEIFRANKFLLFFTPLTAGIVEELIFRGYLQPRMEICLKKPYLAIIISSLLFGLLHYKYGTLFNMVGPFFIGSVFAYHYWKFRNIWMLIICHFLWDLIAIMILVRSS